MKKAIINRLAMIIAIVLITMFLLSACDSGDTRLPTSYTYSPGATFTSILNEEEGRRQIKCAVVFKVIDEQAIDELSENNFVVRNAVLSVLGELTIEDISIAKDYEGLSQRIVDQVNEDLGSPYELVIGAYFTEFALN
jgi:flagellar basal body-associated protein FliL